MDNRSARRTVSVAGGQARCAFSHRLKLGVGLVCGCLALLVCGNVMAFNNLKNALRAKLGINEAEVDTMVALQNLGLCIGLPAGLVFEYCGSRITFLVALFLSCVPTLLLGLFTGPYIHLVIGKAWVFYLLFFVTGYGNMHSYIAVFGANVSAFSEKNRGKVVGLMDCCFSLGTAVFVAIYNSSFTPTGGKLPGHESEQNVAGFFYFCTIICAVVYLLCAILICEVPAHVESDQTVQATDDDDARRRLLANEESGNDETTMERVSFEHTPARLSSTTGDITPAPSPFSVFPFFEMGVWRTVRTAAFWLISTQCIMASTVELLYMENIVTYLRSFGFMEMEQTLMILHFVVQGVSKLGVGILSDRICRSQPRAIFFLHSYSLMGLSLLLFCYYGDTRWMNVILIVVVGHAFGVTWCQSPTIISDLFGADHFPTNWGTTLFLSGVFSLGASKLNGFIYDLESKAVPANSSDPEPNVSSGTVLTEVGVTKGDDDDYCYGLHCFLLSSTLLMALSFIALLMSILLIWKQKQFHDWRTRTPRQRRVRPSRRRSTADSAALIDENDIVG